VSQQRPWGQQVVGEAGCDGRALLCAGNHPVAAVAQHSADACWAAPGAGVVGAGVIVVYSQPVRLCALLGGDAILWFVAEPALAVALRAQPVVLLRSDSVVLPEVPDDVVHFELRSLVVPVAGFCLAARVGCAPALCVLATSCSGTFRVRFPASLLAFQLCLAMLAVIALTVSAPGFWGESVLVSAHARPALCLKTISFTAMLIEILDGSVLLASAAVLGHSGSTALTSSVSCEEVVAHA
jgi:hypothetical protein